MFKKINSKEYIANHPMLINTCKEAVVSNGNCCMKAGNINPSLKATFQFIKDNPVIINGKPAYTYMDIGVFVLKDEDSIVNEFEYSVTSISGFVKEVHETYAILSSIDSNGQETEATISYNQILDFFNVSINDNFEKYIAMLKELPPLCYEKNNEYLDLLNKLSIIISRTQIENKSLTFLLGSVLTREFNINNILIVGNLIILEELFITPITSIAGFVQNASC